jgi:hypothetical protein
MSAPHRPTARLPFALCPVPLLLLCLATPAHAQTPADSRVVIAVNAAGQVSTSDFATTATLHVNQEDGNLKGTFEVPAGFVFDAGGAVRVTRQLFVGVSVSQYSHSGDAAVHADIPHPFFFDMPRAVDGTAHGVKRSETGVHVDLMWALPRHGRMAAKIFGGPSILSVHQDLIGDVRYTESYPFDTATFSGASTTRVSKSAVGVNVGADVTFYLTPNIGVGALVRYSHASVKLPVPLDGDASTSAGGLHTGGGLRIAF